MDVLLTSGMLWLPFALTEANRGGCRSSVMMTCGAPAAGGVSVGDKDFIKPILERKGTVHFGKVGLYLPKTHISCACR